MFKKLVKFFIKIFKLPLNKLVKYFNFLVIFRSGTAIGDQLLISGVSKIIKKQYDLKIILFVKYDKFFLFNPNIYKTIKIDNTKFFDKIIIFLLTNLKGNHILEFHTEKNNKNGKHFYYLYKKKMHIAETHCDHFNLNLDFNSFKNEIFFKEYELEKFKEELKLPKKFSVIQSTSKQSFTKNKEWRVQGMQSIVHNFSNLNWIQVGTHGEPILKNCRQMFDLDFRKLSYIIKMCEFVVSYEGLFNHLASCFNKKNFLIHTGFLPISFSYYPNNILIENNTNIKCYPCYDFECKDHNKFVNDAINEEFVIRKINNNISYL